MKAYQKIIEQLEKANIKYTVHTHEEIPTVNLAKEKVQFDITKCFKTVAFKYKEKFLFISLLAEDKLKYSKLCSNFKIKRSGLNKADSKELEEKYGYESGGMAPISISNDITVIFDKKINNQDTIFCGSGRRDKTLEIKVNDITNMERVILLDISE